MRWIKYAVDNTPISGLSQLPLYAPIFFFKNLGPFKTIFLFLTLISILATLANFTSVYILGDLITKLVSGSTSDIFTYYVPIFLLIKIADEFFDYFTRRYGEAFSKIYGDQLTLRFTKTILNLRLQKLANLSAQRLNLIISKYVGNVINFADSWFWGLSRRLSELVITLTILYLQNPAICLFNILYFALFLSLSFKIATHFSKIAEANSRQELESGTIIGGFLYNLATVKRLNITDYVLYNFRSELEKKWLVFDKLRKFHANRWFFQLNLYNFGYIETLAYGALQVQSGELSVGFLILIKYAFDTLFGILVFFIEYYVSLVQQREDSKIIRAELREIGITDDKFDGIDCSNWKSLCLNNISLTYTPSASNVPINITIPNLELKRGQKLGIIGPSGSGKTTLLNVLMNLIDYKGSYKIDGATADSKELLPLREFVLINNTDPLFLISLRDNILLGKNITEQQLFNILKVVCAEDFASNLSAIVGGADFNLSAGQQQRIRLARGLVQDSSLFLLDEPFNGIDEPTKEKIINNLKDYLNTKSILLVTHNDSELRLVDTTYRFENGELIARQT